MRYFLKKIDWKWCFCVAMRNIDLIRLFSSLYVGPLNQVDKIH